MKEKNRRKNGFAFFYAYIKQGPSSIVLFFGPTSSSIVLLLLDQRISLGFDTCFNPKNKKEISWSKNFSSIFINF